MESAFLKISTSTASVKAIELLNSLSDSANLLLLSIIALGFFVLLLILIWSFVWKGFALWKAAQNNQKWWFIVFLLINTAGILEILYLFVFSPNKFSLKKIFKKKSDINN